MEAALATIAVSAHVFDQGWIVARLADGRVCVDAGGRRVCGLPVPAFRPGLAAAPGGFRNPHVGRLAWAVRDRAEAGT